MKIGDIVRIIPNPDNDDGQEAELLGLILEEDGLHCGDRLFRLLVNGNPNWAMCKDDLEVINEDR